MKSCLIFLMALLLTACASKPAPTPQTVQAVLPEPDHQYMCGARIHLSDATREFAVPANDKGDGTMIRLGELLNQQIQKTFWIDSVAASSGRPMPIVTVGFDGGTGVYRDERSGSNVAHVGLQFQIFRPTGQSYMDVTNGSSSLKATDQAVAASLTQAVQRLESILNRAGICRQVQ